MLLTEDTILLLVGGSFEEGDETDTVSLGSAMQCPKLPALPTSFIPGAAFKHGDIPVVCAGDVEDQTCYQLTKASGEWEWDIFGTSMVPRAGVAYAQIGQEFWLAGMISITSMLTLLVAFLNY